MIKIIISGCKNIIFIDYFCIKRFGTPNDGLTTENYENETKNINKF